MNSRAEIYHKIVSALEQLFEIKAQQISLQSRLYEDLDLDSIDAIDLLIELKNITGKKIRPDDFKSVRTIQDVVEAVIKLLKEG